MRLLEVERSLTDWAAFFRQVHDLGITRLHSSMEYESFPLLCEILAVLRTDDPRICFTHVVKLAEPSFDDAAFSATRMIEKVDSYRQQLGSDCIDDIQWMWRQDLDEDERRIARYEEESAAICRTAQELKQAGSIRRFLCFPYSPEFAETAIATAGIDGLAIYRNIQEREYDPALAICNRLGKTALAIRPLNAGKVFEGDQRTPRELFDCALDMKPIEAGIVSTSSIDHLGALLGRSHA